MTLNEPAAVAQAARAARGALAEGRDATLLIAGVGPLSSADPAVLLHDHGGRPTFVCDTASPVAAAVGRPALLTVAVRGDGTSMATIVVSGRLGVVAEKEPSLPGVVIVALSVEQVILERDDPSLATVTQQVIPLDLYWQAEPDPMAGYADSITAHTSTHHQPQLRAFIAARVGLDIGHVAAAALNELDRYGAQLAWVDSAGAHIMALRFAEPARTPAMLSCLLRSHLDHHHDCDRP